MNINTLCLLCLTEQSETTSIYETQMGTKLLTEILQQYFWFQFNDNKFLLYSTFVCSQCSSRVIDFHKFYLEVKEAHKNYFDRTESINIKAEPINVLEMCTEPQNDETKDNKLNSCTNSTIAAICKLKISVGESTLNNELIETNLPTRAGKQTLKQRRTKSAKIKEAETSEVEIINQKQNDPEENGEKSKSIYEKQIDKLREYFTMSCEMCNEGLQSLNDARDHYRKIHSKTGYLVCCAKRFKFHWNIVQHLEYHENPKAYMCSLCKKTFLDKRGVRCHMQTHASEKDKIFKCKYCSRSYLKQTSLRVHVNVCHSNGHLRPLKRFECAECGGKFGYKTSLRMHIDRVHGNPVKKICDVCAKTFKSQQSYLMHYKIQHTDEMKRVQCDTCGLWLKHTASLTTHLRTHKPHAVETCNVCGKQSPNQKALRAHMDRVHKSEQSFPCAVCEKVFKQALPLKEHMAIHTGEALYTCSFCTKTCRSNANMYKHERQCHPIEYQLRKSCSLCKKTFLDKRGVRCHMQTHASEKDKIFKCKYCSRSYLKQTSLRVHVNVCHSNGHLRPLKRFECAECGGKFGYKTSLRMHIDRVHGNPVKKICDVCAKTFKSQQSYLMHYKIQHTDEMKRVQCDTCGLWLKHTASLTTHLRTHKPHAVETCNVCGKQSPNKKALRAHMDRVHKSEQSFPCAVCEKVFKQALPLKEHMAIHTGEALYTCSFCTKTCRSNANMYKHERQCHPIEYQLRKSLRISKK